jgi:F-type H+-transporting ATPase subunit b
VVAVLAPKLALGLASLPLPQGGMLDFNSGAWLWTWIAFLVALAGMWKLVYGPITRLLEERDKKVEDSIAAAEVARKEAEQRMAEAKGELDKARAEGKRMVEEAVARAERQADEAMRAADERARQELQKARDAIAAEKQKALLELRQYAVELTIAATQKLLQQDVDDEAHRRMVRDFVASSAATGAATAGERR